MPPRAITTLLLAQLTTVIFGVMFTAIVLRMYPSAEHHPGGTGGQMPPFALFMRNYGFLLCLLPCAWAGACVLSVRSLDALPQVSRFYHVAGYVLWAALVLGFVVSACIALRGLDRALMQFQGG